MENRYTRRNFIKTCAGGLAGYFLSGNLYAQEEQKPSSQFNGGETATLYTITRKDGVHSFTKIGEATVGVNDYISLKGSPLEDKLQEGVIFASNEKQLETKTPYLRTVSPRALFAYHYNFDGQLQQYVPHGPDTIFDATKVTLDKNGTYAFCILQGTESKSPLNPKGFVPHLPFTWEDGKLTVQEWRTGPDAYCFEKDAVLMTVVFNPEIPRDQFNKRFGAIKGFYHMQDNGLVVPLQSALK